MERTSRIVHQSDFRILANDPSICAWGFAVLDGQGKILEVGCIKTESGGKKLRVRKGDDTVRRVREINTRLLDVINRHQISYILSELPHGSQSASAAVMIGICIGIMQTISDTMGLGLEWYSEGDSKKNLLGKLSAEKRETIDKIASLYKVPWTKTKYIDEAVADAISIHYCASNQSSTLKLFKKSSKI